LRIESKDQVDEFRFDRINFEALLDLGATTLGLDDAIAEGRSRTVPKALLGRFAHRADDVLAVLARCVFVEDADDLPLQLLRRIIAGWLGHRDHLDAVLAQFTDGELHLRTIAIEAREGMDADDVEAAVGAAGFIKHPLESGRPIISRRGSWLDKFLGDCPAPSLAKASGQVPLRWNGDIAGRLTAGAHPQVERGSPRREWITLRRVAECHGSISIELKFRRPRPA